MKDVLICTVLSVGAVYLLIDVYWKIHGFRKYFGNRRSRR